MPNVDGYPEDEELKRIELWDREQGFNKLLDYVGTIWHWGEPWFKKIDERHYKLSTGGWSGNEDIIAALKANENMFWMFCWQESRRGGHFKFEIPKVNVK